jgi:hypothetical protein
VNNTIAVRNLTDCDGIVYTGVVGAKADFSWNGRYLAFHSPKPTFDGYEIRVVDLVDLTIRTITNLPGSSVFPSWTSDGRICFRYDGDDYQGFMIARSPIAAAPRPLPRRRTAIEPMKWFELFPLASASHVLGLVLVWSPSNAHSQSALEELSVARRRLVDLNVALTAFTTVDIDSTEHADTHVSAASRGIADIMAVGSGLARAGALNQIPTTLLFRDGVLVDRRLGAQRADELVQWVQGFNR